MFTMHHPPRTLIARRTTLLVTEPCTVRKVAYPVQKNAAVREPAPNFKQHLTACRSLARRPSRLGHCDATGVAPLASRPSHVQATGAPLCRWHVKARAR